jgi:ATP phosphoribosyltransferase regulatory subunit
MAVFGRAFTLGSGNWLRAKPRFVREGGERKGNLVNPSSSGESALRFFEGAGFSRVEPSILQPSAPFLDMSGEDIRGRLFLTASPEGEELCLRPDYTIPVCLLHLSGAHEARETRYCYLGPVFRARAGAGGEFVQTGLESFGRRDIEAADAEILGVALEAASAAGAGTLKVRIGDARVFDGVVGALGLPEYWRRRVRRGVARGLSLEKIADRGALAPASKAGVLAALERSDHDGAKALVQDLLSIAGISPVGGRSQSEIADRFLEQAAARQDEGLAPEAMKTLERFLAISGHPDAASRELRALARDAGLDIGKALASFDERIGFMAARALPIDDFAYSAAFVRDLDYYTGFVFEASDPTRSGPPALGGGRYDGLARKLGAAEETPAIGAAIWLDRL